MTPNEFLLIRLSHLGDIVLTTGVLDYWHRTQGSTFHFITSQAMIPLLQDHPAVASVVSVGQETRSLSSWLAFCRSLRQRYGHLPLIDLHGTLRSRILATLWPEKVLRYPKEGFARRAFHVTRCERFRQKLARTNVPQRYSLALEKAPPARELLRPTIPVRKEDREWAENQLRPLAGSPTIALHPYATHPAKQWPEEKWLELIHRLQKQNIASLIIGQSARPLKKSSDTRPENAGTPPVLDCTNSTNLAQTCALLEQADVLVSGDSGPMHLGTAVGTPVVALFGPTSKEWGFYPSGKNDTVITRGASCSPCSLHGKNTCRTNFACMRDISVDQVMEKILEQIPADGITGPGLNV